MSASKQRMPSRNLKISRARLRAMIEQVKLVQSKWPYVDIEVGDEYNSVVLAVANELEEKLTWALMTEIDREDTQRWKTVREGRSHRSYRPVETAVWKYPANVFLNRADAVIAVLDEEFEADSASPSPTLHGDTHNYYGDGYNIGVRSKDFEQTVSIGVPAEQLGILVDRLTKIGISQPYIDQLLEAITQDSQEAGQSSIGQRVKTWVGDIALGVAGNVVTASGLQLDPSQLSEVTRAIGEFASSIS